MQQGSRRTPLLFCGPTLDLGVVFEVAERPHPTPAGNHSAKAARKSARVVLKIV